MTNHTRGGRAVKTLLNKVATFVMFLVIVALYFCIVMAMLACSTLLEGGWIMAGIFASVYLSAKLYRPMNYLYIEFQRILPITFR